MLYFYFVKEMCQHRRTNFNCLPTSRRPLSHCDRLCDNAINTSGRSSSLSSIRVERSVHESKKYYSRSGRRKVVQQRATIRYQHQRWRLMFFIKCIAIIYFIIRIRIQCRHDYYGSLPKMPTRITNRREDDRLLEASMKLKCDIPFRRRPP